MVKNFYPEKIVVPFHTSFVEMGLMIGTLKLLPYSNEVKKTVYVIVRNETANLKYVIGGTNFCGAQSDCGRWPTRWDKAITSTCIHKENMTGKERGFVIFDTIDNGLGFLCDRILSKGIYIGHTGKMNYYKGDIITPEQLADAYQEEWVYGGEHNSTPIEIKNFVSMYKQADTIFS